MQIKLDDGLLLDRFDIGLLSALQNNAYATHQALGEAIHLSASQVSRRIQRLQEQGLIKRYVALLEPARLGLGVRALTYVTLLRHGGEEGRAFEEEVNHIDEVLDCYAVAGEADYMLHIVTTDLSTLSDTVLRRITRIQGVASIRSNIVLNTIKTGTALPLTHVQEK